MKRVFVLLPLVAGSLISGLADTIIPTSEGMTWQYKMTQETGEGLKFSNIEPGPDGRVQIPVAYRIGGTLKIDGQNVLKFEMHRTGVVTNTDFVTVDNRGIVCAARMESDGQLTKLDPPQTMVAAAMKPGLSWDFDGDVAGTKVQQHYSVICEEEVEVPAGKFRAFRIHVEQTKPNGVTMVRWFALGTGIVKDITTIRGKDDELLRRISLELTERPKYTTRPAVKPVEAPRKLSVSVASQPIGDAATKFSPATPKIYARWQGHGLRAQSKIRVVWIAEDVSEIDTRNYTVDEATTTATAPDSHGAFILSRPDTDWAPGDYRVEFYLDDVLTEIIKLKIVK